MNPPTLAGSGSFLPDVSALLRSADALSAQGRHAESAEALRKALELAPTDAAVLSAVARLSALVRTWLTLGQPQQAVSVLAAMAGSPHASGELLMLYGHALMASGRRREAIQAFRGSLARQPGNRNVALTLAAILADEGQPQDAENLVRADILRSGISTESAFVLGRALMGQSRFEEAEAEFRKVVQARPDHQTAQANLMELVWMRTGDVHQSAQAIDRALAAQPHLLALRITKARLLTSARMPREALSQIDAGLAAAARNPALLAAATTIALDFDGQRAFEYAQRLSEVSRDRAAQVALGNASLATGRAQAALEIAEALQRTDPADGQALAMQADARRMLGDARYRELLDYRHLVRAELIDVPSGWPDLKAYLVDLTGALGEMHTLRAHPIGNSLREGSQIRLSPQQSAFAAIRAFPQAIDGPIRRYIDALGKGQDPMRQRNTGKYGLSGIWSVRLRPHGFHVSHYHPEGWISSACYLDLPPAVSRHGGEGWLKFGEPAFQTVPALAPEYFLKPEPGLLALFPSYMWHGTVPFSGAPDDRRLTIAFDVVPAP